MWVLCLLEIYCAVWCLLASMGHCAMAAPYTINITIAVVCMVKNEKDILHHWLDYHSALFGASSIVVLDNYSTDEKTLDILSEWSNRGLHVLYDQGPYVKMGDLAYAALMKLFPSHQLAIPLDIDEFLIVYRHGVPLPHRSSALMTLEYMWESGGPCFAFRRTMAAIQRTKTIQSKR